MQKSKEWAIHIKVDSMPTSLMEYFAEQVEYFRQRRERELRGSMWTKGISTPDTTMETTG